MTLVFSSKVDPTLEARASMVTLSRGVRGVSDIAGTQITSLPIFFSIEPNYGSSFDFRPSEP